jgi:hypothetical protein
MAEDNHIVEVRSEEERRRLVRRQADRVRRDEQEERRALLRRYSLLAASAAIFSQIDFEEGDEQSAYAMAVNHARGLLEEIQKQETSYGGTE